MPKSECKVLKDFYKEYPYQKIHYPTHIPYVSKDEDTDDIMSITYPEWSKAIKIYYKYVLLYLAQGFIYRFSSGIGELKAVKYKSWKQPIDFNRARKKAKEETGEEKLSKKYTDRYKHLNKDIDGFRWKVAWFRRDYTFKYKNYWNFRLTRLAWMTMNPIVRDNIHNIALTDWLSIRGIDKKLRRDFK